MLTLVPSTEPPAMYIPRSILDFIGPARMIAEILERTITNAKGRPLKFLMNGNPGTGKSALAEFIRKSVNADPKWSTFKYNGTGVRVDVVEQIQRDLHYKDLFGAYRMILINEADKIPHIAQVAMLSLLDDLPQNVAVVCTSNSKIEEFEPRFQSRFQVFTVGPAPETEINVLLKQWIHHTETLNRIAAFACGNVRQALLDAQTALDSNPAIAA